MLVLTLVAVGISTSRPPLQSVPTLFLSSLATATDTAAINSIDDLSSLVGPMIIGVIREQTGSYSQGLYFVTELLAPPALVTAILSARANKSPTTEPPHPHIR